VAAGAAAGAGGVEAAGGVAGAAGFGSVALTAVLQAGDKLLTFFCKQANASWPRKPEHFDMASLRQFDRSALCTSLEICAAAGPQMAMPNASA
jgi:hypothetical protein